MGPRLKSFFALHYFSLRLAMGCCAFSGNANWCISSFFLCSNFLCVVACCLLTSRRLRFGFMKSRCSFFGQFTAFKPSLQVIASHFTVLEGGDLVLV